jgi:hypothetical protein
MSARRSWDGVLDAYEYKWDLVGLKERSLHGYSHLVASRQGIFAVNSKSYKSCRGRFLGLTIKDGDIYCFQTCLDAAHYDG